MKAILRSWRILLLAWAVLLSPEAALVHALSHSLPGSAHQHDGDKRHVVAAKACVTCLAFAQVGSALPSDFEWKARAHALPEPAVVAAPVTVARHASAFDARAPPPAPT
jgi:hypothetical protein